MNARVVRWLTLLAVVLSVPTFAFAATSEFRVLFDVDHEASTGCTVGTMNGIEQVFVTQVTHTETTAAVTRTHRLVCTGGVLGAPIDVVETGWPGTIDPVTGLMSLETRIPFTAFLPAGLPMNMRVRFNGVAGSASQWLETAPDGAVLLFPTPTPGRRRAVDFGDDRVIVMDGVMTDWGMIAPMAARTPADGDTGFQFLRTFAFANTNDQFIYFGFQSKAGTGSAPTANDDNYTRNQSQSLNVTASKGVLKNDVDPNGEPLTATKVSEPNHGTVTLNPDGSFQYTPTNPAAVEVDHFTYKASNTSASSNTAKVTIVVNERPNVKNGTLTVAENVPNGTVVGVVDVQDEPGDAHTFSIISGNTGGAFAITALPNGDGQITVANRNAVNFEVNPVFVLTVRATDEGGLSDNGTITINVTNQNDAPVASNSSQSVPEDQLLNVPAPGLYAQASDEDGNALTLSIVANPANGVVTLNPDGSYTYDSNPNYNGPDSFTWRAFDGTTFSNTATVSITVTPVNDEPSFAIAANPPAVNEDAGAQIVNGFASSISRGPADEAGQTLTFNLTPTGTTGDLAFSAGPAIDASGTLTYTPSANTNGTATFDVVLTDSGSNTPPNDNTSATLSFTITVNAVNDPPTFTLGGNQSVNEDSGLQTVNGFASSISVGPANESAQTITAFNVTNDNNGLFSAQPAIDTSGNLTYTPAADANGIATVSVTATDSGGATSSPAQTFTITVNAINDEPSFAIASDPPAVNEDAGAQNVNGFASSISKGPADESAQTLTFTLTPTGTTGDLAFNAGPAIDASGTLTYTPGANTNGTATFNVVLTDSGSNTPPNDNTSATLSFTITVNAVNDPPTFTLGGNQSVSEDAGPQTVNGFASSISVGPANESAQTITAFNVTNDNNGLFSAQPAIDTSGNLTYTPAANASGSATVSVTATDSGGATSSPAQTFTITVNAVNDAPTMTAGGTLSYTENQAATVIDSTITVTDIDSPSLTGATAQITGNYASGQDVLSYVTALGITGSFNAATGTLTLSGTAPVADYQTALRNVLYNNTSDNPSTAARTVTWQVSDGALPSNTPTSTINVAAVNDAPVVNAASSFGYTEGTGAQVIDAALTTSDLDHTQYTGATIQITGNYASGQDVLAFTAVGGITGLFNAGTGTLTLSGTDTIANYQTALRSVTYQNTSTNPSVAARTVTWTVNDGTDPGSDTTTITITAVNSAPVLTAGGTLNYTENQAATAIDTTITVADADTPNLASATAQITGNYVNGEDVLSYVTALGISGSFNAATGTLTLTGSTTPANWQTALRNVLYNNTSDNPSTAARTVTWQIDDGEAVDNLSNTPTSTINVSSVNDNPTINAAAALNYTEDDPATAIDGALTVADLDNTNLTGATVAITANYVNGEDVLAFTNAFGITGSFNAITGVLTLSGTTTVGNYQSALRTVTYQNTSQNPSGAARTITWTVDDGTGTGTDTTTINVTPVNDAPALTITGAISYTENDPATSAATAVNITDADDTNIESATIQITGNYANGQDVLSYATALGITGSFNAGTGTLTLTGSTTLANYITALGNVQYTNTSEAPSTLTRTLTWTVNDGDTNSNSPTSTIAVTAVNDAPVNTLPGGVLSTNEDVDLTGLVFSIADADAGTNDVDVQLIVTNGVITLNSAAGFTEYTNGDGTLDAFIRFKGPLTAWNNALNGVTFRPNANFFGTASIQIITSDQGFTGTGGAQTDDDTKNITVNAVNDAPSLTVAAAPTPSYTENAAAIAIATSASITDIDDTNIESATVQITGNYDSTGDVLSYATALGITGSWNGASGTLTLSGTASLANYQTAIQNVMFVSTSENPSALQRTVTWTVNDGDTNSNSQTTNINVVNVNDPPSINAAAALAYTEDAGAVAIDNALTVTDPDDATLPSATVQVTANYVNGEDILAFTNAFGITGSFNAASGTLTLTGPASPANFQSALRTVTYQNTSNNPSTAPRTVTWTVNDDEPSSGTDTTTINVTATNDAPVLTLSGTLNYTENDAATNIASSASITDADDTNIETATVQITGNYQNGQDVLSYVTALGISGSFNAVSGTLTLTGPASLADFATALQNVKYNNTSENPSTLARTVTYIVNDGDANSNSQTATINVTSVNDAPVVTPTGTPLAYTENDPATAVQPSITVTDVDSTNLTGATIQITTNYVNGQDVLSYVTALGITGSFNAASGTLTLSGTTTVANYQTALRNVLYNNTSENPSQLARTVVWQVNDGAGVNNLSTAQNSTINVTAVNDAPTVLGESFDTIGNTELRVDLSAGSTPNAVETTAGASAYKGVIDNDSDVEGDPIFVKSIVGCADVTAPFVCTLASGGVIQVESNGEFTFTPGPGDTTDSFQYVVEDIPTVGTALTTNGTVTFTISEMVWYVDGDAPGGGNGTSIAPFNNFDSLDGAGGAGDVDDAADYIFVHAGAAIATSATVPLEANQRVLGQGAGLSVPVNLNGNGSPTVLVAAEGPITTRPTVTRAAGDLFTMINEVPVEIRALTLSAAGGNIVDMSSTGALTGSATLTISDNVVNGAGAEGLDINLGGGTTGTLGLTISNNSWNTGGTHTGTAIDVTRTAGTLNTNISNNTNVLSAGTAINVNGTITITGFSGNTVHQNTGGSGITVTNATFDGTPGGTFQTVSGGTTTIGTSGNGVGANGFVCTTCAGDLSFTSLQIFADGGAALSASSSTAYTGSAGLRIASAASGDVYSAAGGAALDLNTVTINNLTPTTVTSTNSAGNGISLTTVVGTFSAGSGSSITNATSTDFNVNGGTVSTSYAGTITDDLGQLVRIINNSGTHSFTGAISDNDDGDGGVGGEGSVNLDNNDGGTVTFSGGLLVSTGANMAFRAVNGGTVNVCDDNPCNAASGGVLVNKLTTTTGTALTVSGTTIGSNSLEFRSIAANGATNGILLNATGSSGGLTVRGTGAADSGGIIQNTTDDAISATDTMNLSLTRMRITNPGVHGIDAQNLRGTCKLENSTIEEWTNATGNGYNIVNTGTAALTLLTITGSTFNGTATSNDGVFMEAQGSGSMTLSIEGSSVFTDMFGDGVQVNGITGATSPVNVTVKNSTFNNAAALGNGGISLQPFGGVAFTADIDGNTLDDIMRPTTNLGAIGGTNGLTATANITIRNNTLNNIVGARGITFAADGSGLNTLLIQNNNIDRLGSTTKYAIQVNMIGTAGGVNSNADVTISGNQIGQAANLWTSGNGTAEAIFLLTQNGSTMRSLVTNNVVTANASLEVIRARAINTSTQNVTYTNNQVTDSVGTHVGELAVATANTATLCMNATGNVLPAAGVGVILISEGAGTTINVTQASSAALSAANSSATVTTSGAPAFGGPACSTP